MVEGNVEEIKTVSRTSARRKPVVYMGYDWSLLFLTLFFTCIGLVFVYSTSSYSATKFGDTMYYFKRQAEFGAIGVIIMIIASFIPVETYSSGPMVGGFRINLLWILWIMCAVLQGLVLITGEEIYGAKRWIEFGNFSFQPSELSKLCLIITSAYVASAAPRSLNKVGGYFRYLLFTMPLVALVVVEDFSTGLVMGGIVIVVCFIASKKNVFVILTTILAGAAGTALIVFSDGFRRERFDAWLNIDTAEAGQQVRRGLFAIASGGLWGKGLGESSMKLGYIPESHNDMIFSIIVEELGLMGAIAMILLYVLLLWRIGVVAINAPTLFGSLICIGVMSHIGLQVIINIAVVTNSIPATGIALPFISYGGTSIVMLLAEIGLVLSISRKIELKE